MARQLTQAPLCAVIGCPIAHSVSPRLFAVLSKRLYRPLDYRRIEVSASALVPFLEGLREVPLLVGANVTLPHKRAVMAVADWQSVEAQAIGAANVLAFGDGQISAHNTDVMGVRMTLIEHAVRIAQCTAVVFGAGGAARAVAYALGQLQAARVVVVNRTLATARALVRDLGRHFPDTRFEARRDAQVDAAVALVVNATSLGMVGQPPSAMALPSLVLPGAAAFDVVYRPALTPFLKNARTAGFAPIGGLDMLIWQALAAYEIWFGRVPRPTALKQALVAQLRREVLR